MNVKLYNSLTKNVEEFKPVRENEVRIYSCGPTVYNYAHIGNMRAFLFADLLQRTIRTVGGYKVIWAMNITNIDDKTIRDSKPGSTEWRQEMGSQTDDPKINLLKFTKFYEEEFLKDISALGINIGDFAALPKATDYMEEMKELITAIYKKGFAYISEGSVYFDVNKWREADVYGKLFNIDFDNFKSGERVDADSYEREQVNDFALWKAKKPEEPWWEFELDGQTIPGRPGWHIECSAMEAKILGLPFDIHTGGVDLKFPHHEDEIAQSKAGYGLEPTNYWCHNEFLEVEGEKMSKSLGNFFTLKDLTAKNINPIDIRFAMLSAHYGSKYNFTFNGIEAAKKARSRVQDFIYALFEEGEGALKADVDKLRNDVFEGLANDLHTPKALAALFSYINDTKAVELTKESKEELIIFFAELNNIFNAWSLERKPQQNFPDEIIELAEKRLAAKRAKNFTEADSLRQAIIDAGYLIKDTKEGYELQAKD